MLSDGNSVLDKIGNILKIFGMALLCFVVFLTLYCGFVSVLIYCCSSTRIRRIFVNKSDRIQGNCERNQQVTVRDTDSLTVNISNDNNSVISQPPPCYEDAIKIDARNIEMEPPSYTESLLMNQEIQL